MSVVRGAGNIKVGLNATYTESLHKFRSICLMVAASRSLAWHTVNRTTFDTEYSQLVTLLRHIVWLNNSSSMPFGLFFSFAICHFQRRFCAKVAKFGLRHVKSNAKNAHNSKIIQRKSPLASTSFSLTKSPFFPKRPRKAASKLWTFKNLIPIKDGFIWMETLGFRSITSSCFELKTTLAIRREKTGWKNSETSHFPPSN